jgi:xanthine dehydrogenase accessory factor
MRDFFEKVAALGRDRQQYATATVVGRRAPVSAHLGDRALVYADGRMEGFVGGACSREIIRRQALECIRTRRPRLVSIRPDADAGGMSDSEHVFVPMTCVSEGAVDVYVEPGVRPRRLVVVGTTPVADALTRTALTLDYEVVRVVDASELRDLEAPSAALGCSVAPLELLEGVLRESDGEAAAVVASQGHYDEQALETILRSGASYVGLVASRKRGNTVRNWLEEAGAPHVESVRYPAGLDLGAETAPEVALSILAEIVQTRPVPAIEQKSEERPDERAGVPAAAATAVDPVCNMEVEIATARQRAEIDGNPYYFCCAQCKTTFLKDPAQFLSALR